MVSVLILHRSFSVYIHPCVVFLYIFQLVTQHDVTNKVLVRPFSVDGVRVELDISDMYFFCPDTRTNDVEIMNEDSQALIKQVDQ